LVATLSRSREEVEKSEGLQRRTELQFTFERGTETLTTGSC
jgi:hypothetical protein